MKIKKILSLILAVFILLGSLIQTTNAIQNENYKFLDGGQPRWIDSPYAMNITTDKDTLSLSGSIYAQYNPMVINYLRYDTQLKGESGYKGLAGWSGIIFIEPKKLKPGINKILYTEHVSLYKDFITTEDSSPFGINIYCGENGKCTINPYAGLSYNFPNSSSVSNNKLRGQTINNENITTINDYVIDMNSSPDFILYSSIEHSVFYNQQTGQNESRIRLSVDVETEPGSGKFRKATDTTRVTAFFPLQISDYESIGYSAFELKFFDYTKSFSIGNQLLKNDINKIWSFIRGDVGDNYTKYSYVFQDYYSYMKDQIFFYLMKLGLSSEKSDIIDPNNPGDENGLNVFQIPKINFKKPVAPTCSFDVFNGISCAVEWLGYFFNNFIYFFVSIFNGIIDFLNFIIKFIAGIFTGFLNIFKEFALWILEGIKSFVWPIFEPILNFFKPVWTDILEPVYNFFFGFFKPIWQLATGEIQFNDLVWGNQQYICTKNQGFYIDTETPASLRPSELLGFFLLFVNPLPPQDGSLICTSIGMKQIEYGRSTIVDTTIFLFFIFAGFWFLLFIVRR